MFKKLSYITIFLIIINALSLMLVAINGTACCTAFWL